MAQAVAFSGPVPVPAPQSTPLSILITGAARGIGFELVKQYAVAHKQNIVLAGVRDVSTVATLTSFASSHPNVHIIPLDVASETSIRSSVSYVSALTSHVDVLINNAGIMIGNDPATVTGEEIQNVLTVNVMGPLLTIQSYLPLLQSSQLPGKVINVSSFLASNQLAGAFGKPFITYGASKAALNFINSELKHVYNNIIFITLNPGWVDTDMGGSGGQMPPTTVNDSAQAIRYYIQEKTLKNSGEYLDVTSGQTLPF